MNVQAHSESNLVRSYFFYKYEFQNSYVGTFVY